MVGQTSAVFRCARGHRFTSIDRIDECPTCAVERLALAFGRGLTIGTDCVHTRTTTRLRWHCARDYHDPKCAVTECIELRKAGHGPLRHCTSRIYCGRDFYATEHQVRQCVKPKRDNAFLCAAKHTWSKHGAVQMTIQVLEICYNVRFDDCTRDLGFEATGYNAGVRVVVIHCDDVIANICSGIAREWCAENNTTFVHVPSDVVAITALVQCILQQLHLPPGETMSSWVADVRRQIRNRQ